jgi:PAS domain S-box-containing protein
VGYHEYGEGGLILSVNNTELEMLGYSREEMIGQPVWKFIAEEDLSRERALKKLAGILPTDIGFERTFRRKDGSTFVAILEDRPFRDESGRIRTIRTTMHDATERKKAEKSMLELQEQLRHSQKMEAVGRLAGGIAHDFNNILTVIKGYTDLTLMGLDQTDPLRSRIDEIGKAANRAASLTQQLLAFSRRQVMEMSILDLNVLLRDLERMLHRVIGEDIGLNILPGPDLGKVRADPVQIEQVIVNLSVNARDAMPQGGRLVIKTENADLDEASGRILLGIPPGPYVMISVTDTGIGMSAEVKERLFEPFFTTKEKGKGTGLGLSTVYGIVKQSGGSIQVDSDPGRGTAFRIYFPRVETPFPAPRERWKGEESPRGNETILVVEDEEEVRRITLQILENQGYRVLAARSGEEALGLLSAFKGKIDLLLTDVVMPGMDGRILAERIRQERPESKVLFMSGYTDDVIAHHGILEEGIHFLSKPFSISQLLVKVRETLDES